jgi:hypothetical protein
MPSSHRFHRSMTVAALCAALALPAAGQAATAADTRADQPNVGVESTRFDKYAYTAGETATVTIAFHNSGAVDAENVAVNAGGNGDPWELEITDWGGVGFGRDITVPAGQTVRATLRGVVPDASANVGRVTLAYGFAGTNGDSDESNNLASARASVPGAAGILTGSSYYDRDGDRNQGLDEGVADVRVTVVGLYDIDHTATVFTDEMGTFQFTGLPVGIYEMRVRPPDGWWLRYGDPVTNAEVRANEHGDISLEVEPRPQRGHGDQ